MNHLEVAWLSTELSTELRPFKKKNPKRSLLQVLHVVGLFVYIFVCLIAGFLPRKRVSGIKAGAEGHGTPASLNSHRWVAQFLAFQPSATSQLPLALKCRAGDGVQLLHQSLQTGHLFAQVVLLVYLQGEKEI